MVTKDYKRSGNDDDDAIIFIPPRVFDFLFTKALSDAEIDHCHRSKLFHRLYAFKSPRENVVSSQIQFINP